MTAESFQIFIPQNLSFQDYLAILQTARVWADGYDLKSLPHLRSCLAPKVTIDYSALMPSWPSKTYPADEFAQLWLSDEHLGKSFLATLHFLGAPYFSSVKVSPETDEIEEVVVSWQIYASHGRRVRTDDGYGGAMVPVQEVSDHRSQIEHTYVKVEVEKGRGKEWRIKMLKPRCLFLDGDFKKVTGVGEKEEKPQEV